MELQKDEIELLGKWIFHNGKIIENDVIKRINFLKDNDLIKIAVSDSGWETLYRDTNDNRYWELVYNNSEEQGGGAPSLINITKESANEKYKLESY